MAKKKKKQKPKQKPMTVDTYAVLRRCVEEGIRHGYNRAFKHTDSPGETGISQHIEEEVMNSICEFFSFE